MFKVRIRELREAAGYNSQQSFADAFGVAQSTVGNWEAGKREPGYETTIRLAKFFDCSTDYLLGLSPFPHAALSGLSSSEMSEHLVAAFKCSKLSIAEVHSACKDHNINLPIEKLEDFLNGKTNPPPDLFVNLCEILGVSPYYKIFGIIPKDLQPAHASIPYCRHVSDTMEMLYPDFENPKAEHSKAEQELLSLCSKLNPAGQKKLADYASDLIASGQYANLSPSASGGSAG